MSCCACSFAGLWPLSHGKKNSTVQTHLYTLNTKFSACAVNKAGRFKWGFTFLIFQPPFYLIPTDKSIIKSIPIHTSQRGWPMRQWNSVVLSWQTMFHLQHISHDVSLYVCYFCWFWKNWNKHLDSYSCNSILNPRSPWSSYITALFTLLKWNYIFRGFNDQIVLPKCISVLCDSHCLFISTCAVEFYLSVAGEDGERRVGGGTTAGSTGTLCCLP